MEVESLGLLDLHSRIRKLSIYLLDSKFFLTLESHISLDSKFHSLPTHTPRFAHATLQSLGSGGDSSLEW